MELTIPLTSGNHEVRLYGAVALKLKMLFTAVTVLLCLTEVKVPTAYIVPPHCTSWRTCSTAPVAFSCGVFAGMAVTGPAGATAATAPAGAMPNRRSPALRPEASSAPGTSRRMRFPQIQSSDTWPVTFRIRETYALCARFTRLHGFIA